jgi:hypothetical protein
LIKHYTSITLEISFTLRFRESRLTGLADNEVVVLDPSTGGNPADSPPDNNNMMTLIQYNWEQDC